MADIKLSYFNARARGETARLILAHVGVRYTDQRLTAEQFEMIKPKLPYRQLPTLKYKGELLCQSITIARFLANEFCLAGRNNAEQAQADEIVDAVNDIFAARVAQTIVKGCIYDTDDKVAALGEQNDDKKSEMMRKLLDETLPNGLARLEARLVERGGQFFVGNNLTWADLHLYTFVEIFQKNNPRVIYVLIFTFFSIHEHSGP